MKFAERCAVLICLLATAACPAGGPADKIVGVPGAAGTSEAPVGAALPLLIRTIPDAFSLTAGGRLAVRCEARRANAPANVALRPEIAPSAPRVEHSSLRSVFQINEAGTYTVRCVNPDDPSVSDTIGTRITVRGAPAVRLEAHVEPTTVQAGATAHFTCSARDTFGNPAPAEGLRMRMPASARRSGDDLTISRAGEHRLACEADGVPTAEAVLQVLPGAPVRVDTTVSATSVQAGDWVQVHCATQDAFGNAVPQAGADFTVRGGGSDADTVYAESAFSPGRVGDYHVQCNLPAGPEDTESSEAILIQVEAGLPHHWDAELSHWEGPTGACYSQNLPVNVSAKVLDKFGNVVDAPLELTADPQEGATALPRGFTFSATGSYHVSARVAGPVADDAELDPIEDTFYVDTTPPEIVILTPARGAMLQGADSGVHVQGVVRDTTGLASLTINNQPVDISRGQRFYPIDFVQESAWGTSLIEIEAVDVCGVGARHVQSYMHSTDYADLSDSAPSPKAEVHLGQAMMQHEDLTVPDSMAALLQSSLRPELLSASMSNTIYAYPSDAEGHLKEVKHFCRRSPNKATGYEITLRERPVFRRPEVTHLAVEDSGLHMKMRVHNIRIPVKIVAYVDAYCLGNTTHSVEAELVAQQLDVDIRVDNAALHGHSKPTVTAHFKDNEPSLEVDWGVFEMFKLPSLPGNAFADDIKSAARSSLRGRFEEQLSLNVSAAIQAAVQTLHWDDSIKLPQPLQGALDVQQKIDGVQYIGNGPDGHIAMGVSARLAPSKPLWPQSREVQGYAVHIADPQRGAIRHADPGLQLPVAADAPFAMAVNDDWVNELFWAVWASGAFDIADLTPWVVSANPLLQSRMPEAELSLFATLPPVMHPSENTNEVRVTWGDLFVSGTVNLTGKPGGPRLQLSAYVTADLRATLDIDKQTQLCVAQIKDLQLHVQAVRTSDRVQFEMLGSALLKTWLTTAVGDMVKNLLHEVPLPDFSVGELPAIPAGTTWRLASPQLQRDANSHGFTLQGQLRSFVKPAQ